MVSDFQWKPFWLATHRDPQNDWTATQNRVNYDVFAQAPFLPDLDASHLWDKCENILPYTCWSKMKGQEGMREIASTHVVELHSN